MPRTWPWSTTGLVQRNLPRPKPGSVEGGSGGIASPAPDRTKLATTRPCAEYSAAATTEGWARRLSINCWAERWSSKVNAAVLFSPIISASILTSRSID